MKVAKAKGRLHGKQPKLNPWQDTHLVALHCTALHRTGEHSTAEHSTAELGDLFGVGRSTVYGPSSVTPRGTGPTSTSDSRPRPADPFR